MMWRFRLLLTLPRVARMYHAVQTGKLWYGNAMAAAVCKNMPQYRPVRRAQRALPKAPRFNTTDWRFKSLVQIQLCIPASLMEDYFCSVILKSVNCEAPVNER